MRQIRWGFLGVLMMAGFWGAKAQTKPAPVPVKQLDLTRYVGKWYEIARYPNRFEKKCVADVTAEYAATGKPGQITVQNRCRKADGSFTVAKGVGKKADGSGDGRLKVSFFRPFWGQYWVLAVGDQYEWSVVGDDKRDYLWVLARTPRLSAEVMEGIKRIVAEQGFDAGRLVMTAQGQGCI